MPEEKKKIYVRLMVQLSSGAAAIALTVLFAGRVLDILMPFLLAFIMAWAFNPLIRALSRHLRVTRKIFSYILVLALYAIVGMALLMIVTQVITQVLDLIGAVPSIISQLQNVYNQLSAYLNGLLENLPPEYALLRQEALALLASAWEFLRGLMSRALSYAVGATSNAAMALPGFVIFLTVLVLASCIIMTEFPDLRQTIYGYLGSRGENALRLMGHSFRKAVQGFFRSQLIFALVDMAIILVAFCIIGVPYPLPIALILCFLDFIPFFGAGTVLVPWGVICIVLGLVTMGAQLLLLYGMLYILRRIFEPRVLGGATGFSSLQMLFAMYAGMKLYGVTGLVLAPVVWIGAVNFLRTGIFNGLLADIHFVIRDITGYIARPEPTTEPADPEQGGEPQAADAKEAAGDAQIRPDSEA